MLKNILKIVLMFFITFNVIKAQNTYVISPDESTVKWTGEKVTGKHWGYVPIDTGYVEVVNGRLKSGQFTIDMTNLTVEDLEDPEQNQKLTGHLKSDDFFSVENYNEAYLRINKALINAFVDEGKPNYTLSGELTIKGNTSPITFPAYVKIGDNKLHGKANFVFDRSKYNVKYGSKTFFDDLGDKMIYNDVSLEINIVGKKVQNENNMEEIPDSLKAKEETKAVPDTTSDSSE